MKWNLLFHQDLKQIFKNTGQGRIRLGPVIGQNPAGLGYVAMKEGDEVWVREGQLPRPIQVLLINGLNLIVGGAVDRWHGRALLFRSVLGLKPAPPVRVRNIA